MTSYSICNYKYFKARLGRKICPYGSQHSSTAFYFSEVLLLINYFLVELVFYLREKLRFKQNGNHNNRALNPHYLTIYFQHLTSCCRLQRNFVAKSILQLNENIYPRFLLFRDSHLLCGCHRNRKAFLVFLMNCNPVAERYMIDSKSEIKISKKHCSFSSIVNSV